MKGKNKPINNDFSSDDDCPLIKSVSRTKCDNNENKQYLYQKNEEKCEFCEDILYNRYNLLVHNASHIVIPLINQKLHRCVHCNIYLPTLRSLQRHTKKKHPFAVENKNHISDLLKNLVDKEPTVVVDKTEVVESKFDVETKSIECEEPIVVAKEEDIFVISDDSCDVKPSIDDLKQSLDVIVENGRNLFLGNGNTGTTNSIRDRLKFEDEIEDFGDSTNNLMSDLTTDCKVNLEVFHKNWINDVTKENSLHEQNGVVRKGNAIILGRYTNLVENNWESVHYDDLMKYGVYKCKKCEKTFPNRYNAVVHETSHLIIKPRRPYLCRLCDWYLQRSNYGYRKHIETVHNNQQVYNWKLSECKLCRLNYVKFKRHMSNYHPNLFACTHRHCKQYFESRELYEDHERLKHNRQKDGGLDGKWSTKVENVCEMCYSFMKLHSRANLSYECLGEQSEVGVLAACGRCKRRQFTLKTVRRRTLRKVTNGSTRPLSAIERLESIRRRMGKIKAAARL